VKVTSTCWKGGLEAVLVLALAQRTGAARNALQGEAILCERPIGLLRPGSSTQTSSSVPRRSMAGGVAICVRRASGPCLRRDPERADRCEHVQPPVRNLCMRSPGRQTRQRVVDELAAAAGADPIDLRNRHLQQSSNFIPVLQETRAFSRWETRPSPTRVGSGQVLRGAESPSMKARSGRSRTSQRSRSNARRERCMSRRSPWSCRSGSSRPTKPAPRSKAAGTEEAAELPHERRARQVVAGARIRPTISFVCRVAVETGMRLGELAALRWDNVDLLEEQIVVSPLTFGERLLGCR
jgi:hypothetical protein